jgi:DNA helicase II / ATP-dependent DNA helicase PcrA
VTQTQNATPSLSEPATEPDTELQKTVAEEVRCLDRVQSHIERRRLNPVERREVDYDTQLLELRDEIAAARAEDVPPLLQQMERLQGIANRQRALTQGTVDARSPYFGRMVLMEGDKRREVLIGRSTYLDAKDGVRIVDWRDAPVSRLYYRYSEGDSYEETFGDRRVEGEMLTRRSLTIIEGQLRRITCPEATFLRPENGEWKRGGSAMKLAGGQGAAIRADQHQRPRKLGVGTEADLGEDKHLREITALIDPRQFELITKPDSGLVVIQGGAGSGKTTIGLHRLAYLAYQDRRRFRPDRMLVVVFNQALVRYISQVLPALDVPGVPVKTYIDWASKLRQQLLPALPKAYSSETPVAVTRLKKSPVLLAVIRSYVTELAERLFTELAVVVGPARNGSLKEAWGADKLPLAYRTNAAERWLERNKSALNVGEIHRYERALSRAKHAAQDVFGAWADLISDARRIRSAFREREELALAPRDLSRALNWCQQQCNALVADTERDDAPAKLRGKDKDTSAEEEAKDELDDYAPIDGGVLEEAASFDVEDDTLLLLLWQRLRGPLLRADTKEALVYEHVLIDEAQDLSPLELGVVLGCTSGAQSVTLAGDVAQRLHMDNGFRGWEATLSELGLTHVKVEPLTLSYRSTSEIVEFSRGVLGPLADANAPVAVRSGAPVELFRFAESGEAVGYLANVLRDLIADEPRASVAVIARFAEQADVYYHGLQRAETPKLRRIAHQDFPFKPGIDVTDIRQVKGLEFDYVILVEVNDGTYAAEDEARHLLHIGATRAAHQLWILSCGKPSPLLPEELRQRSY